MTVLLDSEAIPVAERPAALDAIFEANEVPQRVQYVSAPRQIRHRLELFRYGPNVHMLRNVGTGLLIDRTSRHVAQGAPEQLAVFFQRRGLGNLSRDGERHVYRAGDVGLIDTVRPYSWQSSRMEHFVMLIENPEISLSAEQLMLAGERLACSPLYNLARTHFSTLCATVSELESDAMAALGHATAQLLRAAVITAVGGRGAADALAETLFSQMSAYAEARLHDPELSTHQIATQHYISVRHLYNIWADETGQSPGRWIMTRRLERASTLLAGQSRDVLPIGWVARQCGFANLSHFSRRFREEYGMSPTDWSATSQRGSSSASATDRVPAQHIALCSDRQRHDGRMDLA